MLLSVTFQIFHFNHLVNLYLPSFTLTSLATMLFLLFSLTKNTDLLNPHSQQQQKLYFSEKVTKYTGWMSALVIALHDQLDKKKITHLFLDSEPIEKTNELLGNKLDDMAQKLKLLPYTKSGQFKSKCT